MLEHQGRITTTQRAYHFSKTHISGWIERPFGIRFDHQASAAMSPVFKKPLAMNRLAYAAAAVSALISVSASEAPTTAASASEKSASLSSAAATPTISCPSDKALWVNKRSKAYPVEGDRLFGHTKHGNPSARRLRMAKATTSRRVSSMPTARRSGGR